jgi:succinate dehydrogenase / fumarate reductase membrane anchor subunit
MARRDLGTTGEGTLHFWYQRISGLANLFLGAACVLALTFYGRNEHAEVLQWFSQPWMIGIMLAFILSALWHMKLGLNVVIDDYVHQEGLRLFYQILNIFIILLASVFTVLALVQVLLSDVITPANLINPLMENMGNPSGRNIQ